MVSCRDRSDAVSRRCVSSRVWLFNFANHAVFVFICAASKDFYDPTTGRRIMWVWGTLPNGIQTIPREMTYDPRTNKISACITIASSLSLRTLSTASHDVVNSLVLVDYAPVVEMKQLRSKQPIAVLSAEAVAPGKSLVLKASSASDIELTFEKPVRCCCILCRVYSIHLCCMSQYDSG